MNANLFTRYIRSFYFVLVTTATIGSPIVPRNMVEYIFVILFLFCAVAIYLSLLASMTVLADLRNSDSHYFTKQKTYLRQFVSTHQNRLSSNVKDRINTCKSNL